MRERGPNRHVAPEAPDLPEGLQPAPPDFGQTADWYGLAADARLAVPETGHDLTLTGCLWRGVDAGSRVFTGLRCRDVVFHQCDFAGARLDGAVLTRVRFAECRLSGVSFGGAELVDVVIDRGLADLASFRLSESSRLWALGTSMRESDFYDARLRRSALLDSDLTSANFDAATVDDLSLHGSVVDSLRGVQSLAGGGVRVDASQLLPLGVAALADMGVRITAPPPLPAGADQADRR